MSHTEMKRCWRNVIVMRHKNHYIRLNTSGTFKGDKVDLELNELHAVDRIVQALDKTIKTILL